jgi:hypothetical protein
MVLNSKSTPRASSKGVPSGTLWPLGQSEIYAKGIPYGTIRNLQSEISNWISQPVNHFFFKLVRLTRIIILIVVIFSL